MRTGRACPQRAPCLIELGAPTGEGVGFFAEADQGAGALAEQGQGLGGHARPVLEHAFIAGHQSRFGVGVLLACQQALAHQAAGAGGAAVFGAVALAGGQALTGQRFGVGGPALSAKHPGEFGQGEAHFRAIVAGQLAAQGQSFPVQLLCLGELVLCRQNPLASSMTLG